AARMTIADGGDSAARPHSAHSSPRCDLVEPVGDCLEVVVEQVLVFVGRRLAGREVPAADRGRLVSCASSSL
ncbi:MAG: hypothetical protein ACRD08_11435, partial [Acidimicrobiales bacterium]